MSYHLIQQHSYNNYVNVLDVHLLAQSCVFLCLSAGVPGVWSGGVCLLRWAGVHGALQRSPGRVGTGGAEDGEPVDVFILILFRGFGDSSCVRHREESAGQQWQNDPAGHRKCCCCRSDIFFSSFLALFCKMKRTCWTICWSCDTPCIMYYSGSDFCVCFPGRCSFLLHLRHCRSAPQHPCSPDAHTGGRLLAEPLLFRPLWPPLYTLGGAQPSSHGCLWPGLLPLSALEDVPTAAGHGGAKAQQQPGGSRYITWI